MLSDRGSEKGHSYASREPGQSAKTRGLKCSRPTLRKTPSTQERAHGPKAEERPRKEADRRAGPGKRAGGWQKKKYQKQWKPQDKCRGLHSLNAPCGRGMGREGEREIEATENPGADGGRHGVEAQAVRIMMRAPQKAVEGRCLADLPQGDTQASICRSELIGVKISPCRNHH